MGGQVIQAITQCVKNEVDQFELNEEEEEESMDDDVVTFDLIDTIKKLIKKLQERVKCSIDAVGEIIGDGELKNVYKKFRSDIENLLKNDAKQCLETKGVIEKLK